MPHQCTNCDRTFPDGSKEMLSGCPDCGGNKFQFAPASAMSNSDDRDAGSNSREQRSVVADDSDEGTVSRAAETVRDWVSSSDSTAESKSKSHSNANANSRPRDRTDSNVSTGNQPWPDTERADSRPGDRAGTDTATSDSQTFDEWPDTARPPADRSEPESSRAERRPTGSAPPSSDTEPSGDSERASPSRESVTIDDDEDTAQADARSAVVSPDDLPSAASESTGGDRDRDRSGNVDESVDRDGGHADEQEHEHDRKPESGRKPVTETEPTETPPPEHGRVVSEPSGDRPSLDELREELNDQFESIKIVNPGQYELNLMELYDREEYIVSLQEDGRYVIDVPDSWRDSDD